MLTVPSSIQAKFNSIAAQQPMLVAAIFADAGPMDSLSTVSRLSGAQDPASVGDINVRVLPETGELMLDAGAGFVLNETTNPLAEAYSCEWRVLVSDNYSEAWDSIGWDKTYTHYSWVQSVTVNQAPILLPFTATGTSTVDSIRIQVGNSGNLTTTAYFRFIDEVNGKQVGNTTSLALKAKDAYLTRVISGFAVGLMKGRRYALEVSFSTPNTALVGIAYVANVGYWVKLSVGGFDVGTIPSLWHIPLATGGGCIPMGGREGYVAAGYAFRSLDVCAHGAQPPDINGVVGFSDVIPAQTSLSIYAYSTNDAGLYLAPGVSGWISHGLIASGTGVPPYRYWRFKIVFSGTPTHDDTARLVGLGVTYMAAPVILGTHAQPVLLPEAVNTYQAVAVKAINKLTSSTSALEAKLKTVMVGQLTLELAPEPEVLGLFSRPLRGKRVLIRAGYADVPETMQFQDCIVRDMAYQGGRYFLTILDPLELADVSVPRGRWPAWVADKSYQSGVTVTYSNKSYLSLSPTTGQQPDLFAAVWQDVGSVWIDIAYPDGTHLCDVAADILQNQVNINSERIDLTSLEQVKASRPDRITTGRVLSNPEKAIDILSDIAWLTESYWTMREGRLALIPEAASSANPVEIITPHDIRETLNYRRGWADMKNECLILTQYIGSGTGNEQYLNAIGVADAQSISDYGMAAVHEFKDRWNLPAAVLTEIASSFVARWKNGRRIIRVDASMRLLPIQTGEVAIVRSAQLPAGDVSQIKGIVMQKDLDWMAQSIQITLMEI